MASVETFIAVVDRIIALVMAKKRRKRELFLEVVEPLFNEFQPVVDHYFEFFRKSRSLVKKADKAQLPDVIDQLVDFREELMVARIKVTEMASVVKKKVHHKPVVVFINHISAFFYPDRVRHEFAVPGLPPIRHTDQHFRGATHRMQMINFLRYIDQVQLPKHVLSTYINHALERMESDWADIAREYAHLRIQCLAG